jgi:hypothetical protein
VSERPFIDPVDAMYDGCRSGLLRPFLRVPLYLSSLFLAGSLAGVANRTADLMDVPSLRTVASIVRGFGSGFRWVPESFVSSAFPLTCGGLAVFVLSNWRLTWWWYASVVIQSMICLGSHNGNWPAWILLGCALLMVGTGLWFVQAWQHNCWAREMAALEAENASRIAARERGTEIEADAESEEA